MRIAGNVTQFQYTSKRSKISVKLARRIPPQTTYSGHLKDRIASSDMKACKQNPVPILTFSHDSPYVFCEIARGSGKSVGRGGRSATRRRRAFITLERRCEFTDEEEEKKRKRRKAERERERNDRQTANFKENFGTSGRSSEGRGPGSVRTTGGCCSFDAYVRVVCRRGKPVTRIKPTD